MCIRDSSNGDGVVNAIDLNQVGLNWQNSACGGWSDGDFNGDGIVNATDLNFVGLNWQQVAAAPTEARPPRAALFQMQRSDNGDALSRRTDLAVSEFSDPGVDLDAGDVDEMDRRGKQTTERRRFVSTSHDRRDAGARANLAQDLVDEVLKTLR